MTTPENILADSLLLPELKLVEVDWNAGLLTCEKHSDAEVCHRCASLCQSTYDRRWVIIRDSLVRKRAIRLKILKRRFYCHNCKKPFTESVRGILPRRKTTQRLRSDLREACENFVDLKSVRNTFKVSNDTVYRVNRRPTPHFNILDSL
jgi:transposase